MKTAMKYMKDAMKIIECKFDPDQHPNIGDLIVFYNNVFDRIMKGIVVKINIEDYEEDIYDEFNLTYEAVLLEYFVFVVCTASGHHYIDEDSVYSIVKISDTTKS